MGSKDSGPPPPYKYYLGMHMGLCHAGDVELQEIQFADRVAWQGNASNGQITVNAVSLFGGQEREGGVGGSVDVLDGSETQVVNDYLSDRLGVNIPAFRGIFALVFRQFYVGQSPYLKKPKYKLFRRSPWNSATADINGGMNPANILYETYTNTEWGMGYSSSIIDSTSFAAAAQTLFDEGFGLNLPWNESEPIKDFQARVTEHINAVLRLNPVTGLIELKMIRDDYIVNQLPVITQDDVEEIHSYSRATWGETTNEIVVSFIDVTTGRRDSVTVHNLANIQLQGGVVSQSKSYPGVGNKALAARLGQRDLQSLSYPLANLEFTCDRSARALLNGDPFVLQLPAENIDSVVFRVVEIEYGKLRDGRITITAVEDVFGTPVSSFVGDEPNSWTEPSSAPTAVTSRQLIETPYWSIARAAAPADFAQLDDTSGFLVVAAASPTDDSFSYELQTRLGAAAFETQVEGDFTPYGVTSAPLVVETTSTIVLSSSNDLSTVQDDSLAFIEGEAVAVLSVNISTQTIVVDRGVLDTVPVSHLAGVTIWFVDAGNGADPTEYASTDSIDVREIPVTPQGRLDESLAPVNNIVLNERFARPYPPGYVRLNNVQYPASISGELTVSWAHRDRTQQTVDFVNQANNSNIGPEPNVVYNLRIYGDGDTLKHTETGLTGTSYTYPTATEESENGGNVNSALRIELEAERTDISLISLQMHNIAFSRI